MRIAQVAPLSEAVPPKLYGGTERVIHWLTEELVALGHDVTLFASGDSTTSAKLEACWPRALRLDGSVRDANALHMMMLERVRQRARRLRFPALSSRLLSVLAVLPPVDAVRHDPAWPARPAGAPAGLHGVLVGAGDLDLQCAAAAAAAGALGPHHPSRAAGAAAHAAAGHAVAISRFSDASRRKSASTARSGSRSVAASRSRSPPRSTRPIATTIRRRSGRSSTSHQRRVHRRDQRAREAGLPERRDRAAHADRLARAVRPGDDRGDGLRYAGDRVQPRLGAGGGRRRRDRLHRRGRDRRDRRGRSAAAIVAREDPRGGSSSASRRGAWRWIISRSIAA